jgi:Replication-relaxation
MTERRKRFQRADPGGEYPVSPMDIQVLQLLHRYYYVRTKAIFEALQFSHKYWGKKLRDLYDRGYITKAYFFKNPNSCDVYKLSDKGEKALKAVGLFNPYMYKLHGINKNGGVIKEQSHTLMISDVMCSIEAGMVGTGFTLIDTPEILDLSTEHPLQMKGQMRPITPDRFFGVRNPEGKVLFYALEADTGSFSYDRYIGKLINYQDKYAHKSYKTLPVVEGKPAIENMLTLTVTANKQRADEIRKRLTKKIKESVNPYLFSHFPVNNELAPEYHLAHRLFKEPWDRAGGLEPLSLMR